MITITTNDNTKTLRIQSETSPAYDLGYGDVYSTESDSTVIFFMKATNREIARCGVSSSIKINGEAMPASQALQEMSCVYSNFKIGGSPTHNGEMYIPSDDWDEVELPVVLRTGTNHIFAASNGLLYIGNSNTNSGVWCFDRETKEFEQIVRTGNHFGIFFESSQGDIYIHTTQGNMFVQHIKWKTVTQIPVQRHSFRFFEDSKGNIYMGAPSDTGLFIVNGTTATQILNTGAGWSNFRETINGDVYIFGVNNRDIWHLNGMIVTNIWDENNGWWDNPLEDSKGNIYVSTGAANTGILHISGTTATRIWDTGNSWRFFEDSKGNVYANSSAANTGILHISGTTATRIWDIGQGIIPFFEDSKGNVYVGSTTANFGILHLSGTIATQITTFSTNWRNFFEDSKGNVYVGSTTANAGILHISGTTATRIWNTGDNFNRFFEDSKGNVYAAIPTSSGNIIHLSGTTATQIFIDVGILHTFFESSSGNVYMSRSNNQFSPSVSRIFHLSGTEIVRVWHLGSIEISHLFENNKVLYATSVHSQQICIDTELNTPLGFQSGLNLRGYTLNTTMFIELKRDFPKKIYIPKQALLRNIGGVSGKDTTFIFTLQHLIFNTN